LIHTTFTRRKFSSYNFVNQKKSGRFSSVLFSFVDDDDVDNGAVNMLVVDAAVGVDDNMDNPE